MMPLHCSGDSSATFSEVSASKVCQGKNQGGRSSNQMKVVRAKRKKKPRQPTEQIMTCEDEIALIADYLSLSPSSRVLGSFEEHLNGCRDCTAFLQTYKKTIEVTRVFLGMPSLTNRPRKLALRVPNVDGNRH